MGYFLLSLSLFFGSAKGYCGKITSNHIETYKDAMLSNTIRMLFCILIGFAVNFIQYGISAFVIDLQVFYIILLSGIASSVFVVSWLVCVKKGAYMMMDVFLMAGLVIPLLGSYLQFDETISIKQLIGLGILLLSVVIMCSYNNSIKTKMRISSLMLLILCGVSCGFSDYSQKLFVEYGNGVSLAAFNFYTYLVSAVLLFTFYMICSRYDSSDGNFKIKNIIWYIFAMSVCLFANSYFQTWAAEFLSSAQLYPLSKGAALILSALMSAVLFKERLTSKAVFGMLLAFASLMLINT